MLDRDCGEHSVHDEGPGGLRIAHEFAQDVPVPLARLDDACRRLAQP